MHKLKCISWKIGRHTFGYVRPVKFPISLRIRAVWSESSLGAFWIVNDARLQKACFLNLLLVCSQKFSVKCHPNIQYGEKKTKQNKTKQKNKQKKTGILRAEN